MNPRDEQPTDSAESDLQREIRKGRKFTLAEAIGRMAGNDLMKGASPVTRKRQAELFMKDFLNRNLPDVQGALRTVLLRRITEGPTLIEKDYDALQAMAQVIERMLASQAYLESVVHDVDIEWGRANLERPFFERPGQEPHPDDPYTVAGVRAKLTDFVDRLTSG